MSVRKPVSKLTGMIIESAERLNNSVNGNPRWRVHFTTGEVFKTQSDAACNYEVSNYLNPRVRGGKPVTITLTRAGRIATIEAEANP